MNRKLLQAMLLVSALISLLGCQFFAPTPAPTVPPQPPATTAAPTAPPATIPPTAPPATATPSVELPADVRAAGFAQLYRPIAVELPARYQGGPYALPVALTAVPNAGHYTFSPAQQALLQQNGFVVTPAEWLEFFQLYEAVRYDEQPVFVTTDAVYHVYHLLFDKLLRDLERERFIPILETLTNALADAAQAQYEQARGTPLEDAARRVWGYFVVPQQLLLAAPPPIPAPVQAEVQQELAQIAAHDGIYMSPLLTLPEAFQPGQPCDPNATPEEAAKFYCEDYSQYVPRGHYTRDERLQRYFRAMMWYGRINLRLKQPRETQMALLITRLLRQTTVDGVPAAALWANIYDPTVFMVGKADDLGFHEYGAVMEAVYGPEPTLALLADDTYLQTFIQTARQLPPPQINSMWVYIWEDKTDVTQGFRFMGQRFVLDAYIFGQLIERNVKDRWLPKGLDVFAALGSPEAYTILQEMGETEYLHYDEQLAKVQSQLAALEQDSWTQNLYWNWLYALQPLGAPKGEAYPPFMQTQAWARKDLHTALGSWTELKHDTILYAKQVMAELGGGGEEEVPPRGYVEPNPTAYARLRALTQMTRAGLDERGLLEGQGTLAQTAYYLEELDEMLGFLQSVAERELRGEALSDDEYFRLKYFGGWLERVTMAAADTPEGSYANEFSEDEQAALVADVATDPQGQVLEEATGRIYEIYVVVPDGQGGLVLAKGGVYSYYEFAWPLSNRLTDEAWRQMVTEGQQPAPPAWTSSFIAQ